MQDVAVCQPNGNNANEKVSRLLMVAQFGLPVVNLLYFQGS